MINEYPENPKPQYKNVVLIWGVMIVSIAMYVGLAEFLVSWESKPAAVEPTLFYMFLGLGIVEVLAIPFIKNHTAKVSWKDFETPEYEEIKLAKQGKFMVSHIIAFALAESVALYGLVLALQRSGTRNQFYTLIAISVFAMVINYPSRTKWDTLDGTGS